jgi:hypothetical protein
MATQKLHVTPLDSSPDARVDAIRQREIALSRMVMTYIGTGLAFMLLPGTFLGVWNLISISDKHAANSISPAWIQAHGQAQVFGWIGTFILGIGFYSVPKMRRAQAFAMWEAWVCWAMWTVGVLLRWFATVYNWHWRISLPLSAALQLLAFALFFKTVSSHRPATNGEERSKLERWIFVVIAGTVGLLATLVANLIGSVQIALHSSAPAFAAGFDQRFLVLMAWGFMVPFVCGFSARWLSTFFGLRAVCGRGLMVMILVNTGACWRVEAWENIRLVRGNERALDQRLQVADLLLCCGGVLELCGRGALWILHQSAHRAVLHAGIEHHAGSRPHRIVRRLWHARSRLDVVLPACTAPGSRLEGQARRNRVLVHQHWTDGNGAVQPLACRANASMGLSAGRHLVRALG